MGNCAVFQNIRLADGQLIGICGFGLVRFGLVCFGFVLFLVRFIVLLHRILCDQLNGIVKFIIGFGIIEPVFSLLGGRIFGYENAVFIGVVLRESHFSIILYADDGVFALRLFDINDMPIGVCRNFYAVIEGNRALLCINRTGGIAVRHDFQLSLALEGQLTLAVNPVAMIGKGVQAVIAALDTHRAFIGQINRRALLQLPLRNGEGKVFNGQRLAACIPSPACVCIRCILCHAAEIKGIFQICRENGGRACTHQNCGGNHTAKIFLRHRDSSFFA